MNHNPVLTLRTALQALLDGASFNYDQGDTRQLIAAANRALAITQPAVVHERAVGIFRYDPEQGAFVQAEEDLARSASGDLRPGYEYLFRNPVVALKR